MKKETKCSCLYYKLKEMLGSKKGIKHNRNCPVDEDIINQRIKEDPDLHEKE